MILGTHASVGRDSIGLERHLAIICTNYVLLWIGPLEQTPNFIWNANIFIHEKAHNGGNFVQGEMSWRVHYW